MPVRRAGQDRRPEGGATCPAGCGEASSRMPATVPTRTLDVYPSRTSAAIRYADTDRQGHVNNAVFATFSEIGRVAFLYDPAEPLAPEGASFVVARLSIDFHAEL